MESCRTLSALKMRGSALPGVVVHWGGYHGKSIFPYQITYYTHIVPFSVFVEQVPISTSLKLRIDTRLASKFPLFDPFFLHIIIL